ncbi:MAG: Hsp70 family protein [Mycobacterium sp.]
MSETRRCMDGEGSDSMGKTALAVDFGSSNTAAAFRDASGNSHKIQLSSDGFLMPSAVFCADDKLLVGRAAMQAAMSDPEAFESSPKRRLGDGEVVLAGTAMPVTRLVAAVLSEVLSRSRKLMGVDPDDVVLTHPDKWGAPRQELLASAAGEAGIDRERVRLVTEATSAAWYYTVAAAKLPVGSRLAVFDFGAGTCDVAVLDKQSDETFTVVGADGIEGLGGQDLDARVYRWVRDHLAETDRTLLDTMDAEIGSRLTLIDRLREAKEALSEGASAPIIVSGSTGSTVLQLTRDEFEDLIGADIERAVTLTRDVLADAEKRKPATSPVTIYLTGGSSAIPLVHSRLSTLGLVGLLGDPKTVVAQGALLVPLDAVPVNLTDADTVRSHTREIAAAAARTMASIPLLKAPTQGWYRDPRNPRAKRFWNGTAWTLQPFVPEATAQPETKLAASRDPRPLPARGSQPTSRRQHPGGGSPRRPAARSEPVAATPPSITQPIAASAPPALESRQAVPPAADPATATQMRPAGPSSPAPFAPTQPKVPLLGADESNPPPSAETRVAPLPIFPRSNPGLPTADMKAQQSTKMASTPMVSTQTANTDQESTQPAGRAKAPPRPPDKPTGWAGIGGGLPGVTQALISAVALLPTLALFYAFTRVGDSGDFTAMWQWENPSTVWFVAPYLYLIAAVLLFGRTSSRRRDAALVALVAFGVHLGASAAAPAFSHAALYPRLVYGFAGAIALMAWAIARRRRRGWLIGLVLAAPGIVAIRYVDKLPPRLLDVLGTIGDSAWLAEWVQYVGSFVVCSVVLWAADAMWGAEKPAAAS